MKVNRRQQLKMLGDAFGRLENACSCTHEWDRYLDLHRKEERQHRTLKPDHVTCGLTRAQAVRLFAVKEIFERFGMPNCCVCGWLGAESTCQDCGKVAQPQKIFTPSLEDYFSIRQSCYAAVAIAKKCEAEIWQQFDRLEMVQWLATVDYCALNKDHRQEVAA